MADLKDKPISQELSYGAPHDAYYLFPFFLITGLEAVLLTIKYSACADGAVA